eukprot:1382564-Pleurochrysis_carterae.AAC.1
MLRLAKGIVPDVTCLDTVKEARNVVRERVREHDARKAAVNKRVSLANLHVPATPTTHASLRNVIDRLNRQLQEAVARLEKDIEAEAEAIVGILSKRIATLTTNAGQFRRALWTVRSCIQQVETHADELAVAVEELAFVKAMAEPW